MSYPCNEVLRFYVARSYFLTSIWRTEKSFERRVEIHPIRVTSQLINLT